jgi:amidase
MLQTNCLTEIFVERALARAREVDDYLAKTGKSMGPLHGLPISMKDQFSMRGLETIMGASPSSMSYTASNSP